MLAWIWTGQAHIIGSASRGVHVEDSDIDIACLHSRMSRSKTLKSRCGACLSQCSTYKIMWEMGTTTTTTIQRTHPAVSEVITVLRDSRDESSNGYDACHLTERPRGESTEEPAASSSSKAPTGKVEKPHLEERENGIQNETEDFLQGLPMEPTKNRTNVLRLDNIDRDPTPGVWIRSSCAMT